MVGKIETAVDTCPERMNAVDAEATKPIRSEAGLALETVVEESGS